MLKSMTGYGSCRIEDETCVQEWEIKSVNGKHLGVRWRLPAFLRSYEPAWEKEVRRIAERGRIEVNLLVTVFQPELMPVKLNHGLALAMFKELDALAGHQGHTWEPDYTRLLSVSSLWQESSLSEEDEQGERFRKGLIQVLREWDGFRASEGQALVQDLQKRVQHLTGWVQDLGAQTEGLAEERFQVLRERVRRIMHQTEAEIDELRMLQEMALLADRLDVSEELTRLRTHIQSLAKALQEQTAGGRKLDFMLQECFREINTLGNKAQNTRVSQLVVDFKSELEKCREQVQNLE
ncbi:MAG: YicC/YloC family endoribonuclease [Desulfovermiculus sp.]